MPSADHSRRLILAIGLGTLLYFIYLSTFSGIFTTNDEQFIIDTTASFATRTGPDRLLLNQTTYLRGLQTTDVEPAQPILAVPLYWVAYHIPWVGNVHILFLFNLIVTALTAIILFYYAIRLGYSEKIAVTAALLFGLTTIVWPYTKTFFREPLTMLTLTACAYSLLRWREAFAAHNRRGGWGWGALTLVAAIFAILCKEAALLAIPILLAFNLPGWSVITRRRREVLMVAITLLIFAAVTTAALIFFRESLLILSSRYEVLNRFQSLIVGLPDSWYATLAYLFSPARGLFWYSPVLILALCGPLILPHARWREAYLPIVMLLTFAFLYAAIRGPLWFGGKSWGGRYLVPIVPFVMLGTLPMLDRILTTRRPLPKVILALLALIGLAIQIAAGIVPIDAFLGYQQSTTTLVPWNDAIIWSIRWSQALGTVLYVPTFIWSHPPDVLWFIPQADWPAIIALILAILSALASLLLSNRYRRTWHSYASISLAAALILGVTLFVLSRGYDDPRYDGTDEGLIALRTALTAQAAPSDVVMLASPRYVPHFMNYYKGAPIWYSLPVSPGETSSCERPPLVESDDPADLISPITAGMRYYYHMHNISVWIVVDYGPMLPCAARPVEHYLSENAYQIQAVDYSPTARLVEYNFLIVPESDLSVNPVEAYFGDEIVLLGYDLATSPEHIIDRLQPGGRFGVSLLWSPTRAIETDYTFALFLIGPNGTPVTQQDRPSATSFPPTSQWQPQTRVRENFGVKLPQSLARGDYQLMIVIYTYPSLERLPVTAADGTSLGDSYHLTTLTIR